MNRVQLTSANTHSTQDHISPLSKLSIGVEVYVYWGVFEPKVVHFGVLTEHVRAHLSHVIPRLSRHSFALSHLQFHILIIMEDVHQTRIGNFTRSIPCQFDTLCKCCTSNLEATQAFKFKIVWIQKETKGSRCAKTQPTINANTSSRIVS